MNMDALGEVVLAIAQQRSVAGVLQRIVEEIADYKTAEVNATRASTTNIALVRIWLVLPGDICAKCTFQAECPDRRNCLHLCASAGIAKDKDITYTHLDGQFSRFPLGVRKIGRIGSTGKPILIPDLRVDQGWFVVPTWIESEGIKTFAGHPLIFRDQTLGVLGVFSRTFFRDEDFERLQNFANHAAVAIANARAFEEIEALKSRLEGENTYLREEVSSAIGARGLVGKSEALEKVMAQVRLVAKTEATVLLSGESGTGKELVARAIHEYGARKARALIKVNCSAIPENLFEAEFFGHVRGAFTGAHKDRPGRFELADGGTLFLDEIGELPLAVQAKLLRVLQEQEVERVGDTKLRKIDVRLIAATNRDLGKEVEAGRFRSDLYYRLNVFPIEIPPLRLRRDDIAPLALHFAEHFAQRMRKNKPHIDAATMSKLVAYDWPGNVRELQNAMERALILWEGKALHFDLPKSKAMETSFPPPPPPMPSMEQPLTREALKKQEKDSIIEALKQCSGKVFGPSGAAALLGMKPTTLNSRIKALGIQLKNKT